MRSFTLILVACFAIVGCGGIASRAADAGPSTPYVGYVNAGTGAALGAGFFPTGTVSIAPSTSVASLCASPSTVSGNCCYSTHVLDPPSQFTGVGAGTLTVSVGGTVIASMTPEGSAFQYFGTGAQPWNPRDVLQVTASGDVIHAFSGSIQTPSTFVVTPGVVGGVILDRSKDFVTTWTPDTNPNETVSLYLVVSPGAPNINCQAPDNSGQLTIPAQLLAATTAGASVITNVYRSANATATADNATVYLSASTLVTWTGTLQ